MSGFSYLPIYGYAGSTERGQIGKRFHCRDSGQFFQTIWTVTGSKYDKEFVRALTMGINFWCFERDPHRWLIPVIIRLMLFTGLLTFSGSGSGISPTKSPTIVGV